MNTENFSELTALVTGAAGGMGRAMTLALARAGTHVAAIDRRGDDVGAVAAEAAELPGAGRVLPLACDTTDPAACESAVAAALEALNTIDVLVNNAGVGMQTIREDYMNRPVKFWEADPARWQRMVDVNFKAPFLFARLVAPAMIARGWGRIVNVTTSLDTMIRGAYTPYGQSKAALEAATSSWAKDLEGTGVTVNVLVPGGPTNTAFIPANAPFDRDALIQPEVMAAPLLWLSSPESNDVTDCRIVACDWDTSLPVADAADRAKAPAAWPDAGTQAVWPGAS